MQALLHDPGPNPDWESLRPVLDTAMHELNEADREVILLRYFENWQHADIGEQLGLGEDAARKRIERALEKLRTILSRRGVTTTVALSAALSANAVQAAPVGLAVTISAAATAATLTTATVATHTTMHWLNIKSVAAIVTAAIAAGTGTHLVQQRESNRLRSENQDLTVQQEKLTGEREAALSAAIASNSELERLRKERSELLRLRGEVGMLRRQTNDLEKLRDDNRLLRSRLVPAQSQQVLSAEEEARRACINNLRRIDGAVQQCALENRFSITNVVTTELVLPFFQENQIPRCPSGGTYALGILTNNPTCSIPGHALPVPESTPAAEAERKAMNEWPEAYKRASP